MWKKSSTQLGCVLKNYGHNLVKMSFLWSQFECAGIDNEGRLLFC